MTIHSRIYASGAVAFGGQPAIDDLRGAGYSAVIVWSVHVDWDGTLFLNDTKIVSAGSTKKTNPRICRVASRNSIKLVRRYSFRLALAVTTYTIFKASKSFLVVAFRAWGTRSGTISKL